MNNQSIESGAANKMEATVLTDRFKYSEDLDGYVDEETGEENIELTQAANKVQAALESNGNYADLLENRSANDLKEMILRDPDRGWLEKMDLAGEDIDRLSKETGCPDPADFVKSMPDGDEKQQLEAIIDNSGQVRQAADYFARNALSPSLNSYEKARQTMIAKVLKLQFTKLDSDRALIGSPVIRQLRQEKYDVQKKQIEEDSERGRQEKRERDESNSKNPLSEVEINGHQVKLYGPMEATDDMYHIVFPGLVGRDEIRLSPDQAEARQMFDALVADIRRDSSRSDEEIYNHAAEM